MGNKVLLYLDKIEKIMNGEYVQPVTVEIDPSNRCNLNCSFCMYSEYRKNNNVDLNIEDYNRVINELSLEGTKSITFTGGGEPTMNPKFNHMVEMALAYDFEIGLITNGIKLLEVKNKKLFKFIRVSLNAATRKTYEEITGKDYFNIVINNIEIAIRQGAFIGISYVVNEINNKEIENAKDLAESLGVKYIQYKPSVYHNGDIFNQYCISSNNEKVISTKRYKAIDDTPCKISELIGVIGADSNIYYCCQYRGNELFKLGSISSDTFRSIWSNRKKIFVDVSKCPHCRGMNYAKVYKSVEKNSVFFDHKHFL